MDFVCKEKSSFCSIKRFRKLIQFEKKICPILVLIVFLARKRRIALDLIGTKRANDKRVERVLLYGNSHLYSFHLEEVRENHR